MPRLAYILFDLFLSILVVHIIYNISCYSSYYFVVFERNRRFLDAMILYSLIYNQTIFRLSQLESIVFVILQLPHFP